ncbi:MAG: hypothetical protein WD645_04640 [Dehalococcoidia bacterium]
MNAVRELLSLYLALAIVPLVPLLALTYSGAPWQAVALAATWTACWYVWLWGRLRGELNGEQ